MHCVHTALFYTMRLQFVLGTVLLLSGELPFATSHVRAPQVTAIRQRPTQASRNQYLEKPTVS